MASEYLKWKYRDVQPERAAEMTPRQRRRNWWHYHKWHVGIAAAAVLMAANWVWNVLTQVRPDYQIAYVGSAALSDETAAAWEARFADLGMDCNGDGRVVAELRQYPVLPGQEQAMYNYASSVKLMADLDSCESYFFLLEDPEGFQAGYEVLREDWFPAEGGLYLARREFREDRTAAHMEECGRLWERLVKEGS